MALFNNNKNNKDKKPLKPFRTFVLSFSMYWMYAIIIMFLIGMLYLDDDGVSKDVPFSQFEQIVEQKGITKIVIFTDKKEAEAVLTDDAASKLFHKNQFTPGKGVEAKVVTDIPSADKLDNKIDAWRAEGKFNGEVKYEKSSGWSNLLWAFGPMVLFIAFWIFMMRRMSGGGGGGNSVFNVGKSKAQIFDKNNANKVTFDDVAGLSEAKTEIEEIVEFLKNPQRYTDLGGKIPKGALLVGPPGTGKTLLAKAVAGEANVPFFSMSGSDFVEMFVGVGASRVRDLFRQAKEKAPCIVFIDEIDAVGRARGRNANMGSNDERENTLNQLLTEMDGFGANSGVIILAATNRADILDKALLRAGRFDRQIHVELPGLPERKQIFKVHMKPLKIDDSVDIDLLSRQTPGFSGADIANVCNEAALIAARKNHNAVGKQDFLDAIDRILGGLEKKTKVMTQDEKRTIALHEAGHATVSWFLQYANPLVKVTIVPRGQALGAAWYLPEERTITTKEQMLDEICATLGGRAAEELFTGHISSGALNDLETVTKRAFGMVAYLGMSEKLSNLCYYNQQQEYSFSKPFSEKTAELIDEEVKNLIQTQYKRAKALLSEHKDGHARLAQVLIDREVIFADDVEEIFGKRPWISRSDEIIAENERIQKEDEEREKALAEEVKAVVASIQEREALAAKEKDNESQDSEEATADSSTENKDKEHE